MLPTRDNLLTMDYAFKGQPFCNVATKAGIELDGLDYGYKGQPWWGLILITPGGGTNIQINIGDVWKVVSAIKINIGDVWKDVVSVKQNIGDSWKTVY